MCEQNADLFEDILTVYFNIMIKELEEIRPEEILMPAPDPQFSSHKIRVVVTSNPEWYRELCAMHPKNRRNRAEKYTDSKIKRDDIIKILKDLAAGKANRSKYKDEIIELTKERIEKEKEAYYG